MASVPPHEGRALLEAGARALGIELGPSASEKLIAYVELLVKWNRVYNLTAIRAADQIVTTHLLDSLAAAPYVPTGSLLDVGSGAGLPGIPLAIARPELEVSLAESSQKKSAFLQQAVSELGLLNVSIHSERVEIWQPAIRYDAIISRAFAELARFVRLTAHLLAPTGIWLAMKGTHPKEELRRLPATVRVRGVVRLQVPNLDAERHLVIMEPS